MKIGHTIVDTWYLLTEPALVADTELPVEEGGVQQLAPTLALNTVVLSKL